MRKSFITFLKFNTILFIISVLTLQNLQAQFEQKFTLHGGIGLIAPIGAADYYSEVEDETIPYIMSNFGLGVSAIGGIRYNFNRMFSVGESIRFLDCWNWYYEYYDPDDDEYY